MKNKNRGKNEETESVTSKSKMSNNKKCLKSFLCPTNHTHYCFHAQVIKILDGVEEVGKAHTSMPESCR